VSCVAHFSTVGVAQFCIVGNIYYKIQTSDAFIPPIGWDEPLANSYRKPGWGIRITLYSPNDIGILRSISSYELIFGELF